MTNDYLCRDYLSSLQIASLCVSWIRGYPMGEVGYYCDTFQLNSPGIVLMSVPCVIFFHILKIWNWGSIRPASDVVGGFKHGRYDDLPGRPYLPCWDYFWGAASGACIACRLDRGGVSHRLGEVDILRYRQLHTWWSGGGVKGHISWKGWKKQWKDG